MPDSNHDSQATIAVETNPPAISPETTAKSEPFVGQWNQLISTTNWDKGEIICNWRRLLEENRVTSSEFSDEAWSQMVGGVSPQHVGRLRRSFERFGHVYQEYDGIYWSHFYAALDWDDAEMWLEGAVQNKWSVSAMRRQRWETLGKVGDEPSASDVVTTELAEESQSLSLSEKLRSNDRDYIEGPVHDGPDWGDEDRPSGSSKENSRDGQTEPDDKDEVAPHAIRPFESFQDLPEDVTEVASAFKVAIIRHKADEWNEISREDMIGLLDALKQLATIAAV